MLVADAGGAGSDSAAAGANEWLSAGGGGSGLTSTTRLYDIPSVRGGQVYVGEVPSGYTRPPVPGDASEMRSRPVRTASKWISPAEANQLFWQMSRKQQFDVLAKGLLSGQLKEGAGIMEAGKLWQDMVATSAKFGASGQKVGPIDLLNMYVSAAGFGMSDQQRFKSGQGNFPSGAIFDKSGKYSNTYRDGDFIVDQITGKRQYVGPKFTTQQQVDLTDPATAKALVTSVFQQLMGRDPGAGELGGFAQALQSAEQANPVTVTTSNQYDEYGVATDTTSTRTGGLDAQGKQYLLEQKAKQNPEYGATQAATTYMAATERAIWGGPGA